MSSRLFEPSQDPRDQLAPQVRAVLLGLLAARGPTDCPASLVLQVLVEAQAIWEQRGQQAPSALPDAISTAPSCEPRSLI